MIFISNPPSNVCQSKSTPFHPGQYPSVKHAWSQSINEDYWRLGLVINQGNKMNVSAERCRERLKFVASRLLRAMYGNKYRRKGHKVHFIVAGEGTKESYNLHLHVLMAVEGDHGWSDFKIKLEIASIDSLFLQKFRMELGEAN